MQYLFEVTGYKPRVRTVTNYSQECEVFVDLKKIHVLAFSMYNAKEKAEKKGLFVHSIKAGVTVDVE